MMMMMPLVVPLTFLPSTIVLVDTYECPSEQQPVPSQNELSYGTNQTQKIFFVYFPQSPQQYVLHSQDEGFFELFATLQSPINFEMKRKKLQVRGSPTFEF
eukprot:TRINITY_DN33534_c0_g1_i1.p2 TRINITY_DN33534_c0_g1~~TRINITY_DN33534_c0_g1_i1.p2  ORF type:complete len:101 (+),score=7.33 TRINITY_DN33534_c0_g1_i1:329-631(+)